MFKEPILCDTLCYPVERLLTSPMPFFSVNQQIRYWDFCPRLGLTTFEVVNNYQFTYMFMFIFLSYIYHSATKIRNMLYIFRCAKPWCLFAMHLAMPRQNCGCLGKYQSPHTSIPSLKLAHPGICKLEPNLLALRYR